MDIRASGHLSIDEVPEIRGEDDRVNVIVWDERNARKVRRTAVRLGIPDAALQIARPLVFLPPHQTDAAGNDAAIHQYISNNVREDAAGNTFLVTGLEPVVGAGPRVLVLGSMPGQISLDRGEYYANPQNRFWRVMERIAAVPATATYEERVSHLTSAGIALWDTLKQCSRIGSLDARIDDRTAVPNEITGFLANHPTVQRIVFNGRKAAQLYARLIEPELTGEMRRGLQTAAAPSTSAANTRVRLEQLVHAWALAFGALPQSSD